MSNIKRAIVALSAMVGMGGLLFSLPASADSVPVPIAGGLLTVSCKTSGGRSVAAWSFTTGNGVIEYDLVLHASDNVEKGFRFHNPEAPREVDAGVFDRSKPQDNFLLFGTILHRSGDIEDFDYRPILVRCR